jgi:hypothetical protein
MEARMSPAQLRDFRQETEKLALRQPRYWSAEYWVRRFLWRFDFRTLFRRHRWGPFSLTWGKPYWYIGITPEGADPNTLAMNRNCSWRKILERGFYGTDYPDKRAARRDGWRVVPVTLAFAETIPHQRMVSRVRRTL